ncbi:MAG: YlxR family protein [Myxococcales bacterium]|nr:YlxR family protein [Myxococcota bacterium]MDW8280870.1 YlxR family protein [Myxococcales bacterium]
MRHVPIRTCVGCRTTDAQLRLWRAVVDAAGRLHIQTGGPRQAGRGAYVHPEEKCLIAAISRGGFERSFRRKLLLPETAALLALVRGAGAEGSGADAPKQQGPTPA